jgi:hypothetical protein
MMIRFQGSPAQRRTRREACKRVITMEFATYLNSLMLIPDQIIDPPVRKTGVVVLPLRWQGTPRTAICHP